MPAEEQEKWLKVGNDLKDAQLARVRDYEGKWASTIGALTGVSSIITVLTARDTISRLSGWYQLLIAILMLIALTAATAAVYLASRAQIGDLRPILIAPRTIRDYSISEPFLAADAIKKSQGASLLAVILLVAAIYVTWLGSTTIPERTFLYTQGNPEHVTCGELGRGLDNVSVVIKQTDAPPVTVIDGSKLIKIDRCP